MITTQLSGLFPPDYRPAVRVNLSRPMRIGTPPPTQISDARILQRVGINEHEFFEENGFVLLRAPTAVTNWSDRNQLRIYFEEVENLIRSRLFPQREVIVTQPPFVMRRGPGADISHYAVRVHQDHGVSADDYQHNMAAFEGPQIAQDWRSRVEQDDVEAFLSVNFWRTTNMAGALQHMPLAFCHPSSLDPADIIPTSVDCIAPGGVDTHHLGLRFNAGQRWYYYSGVKPDEVLVFKIFQLTKGEDAQLYRACFHTAVNDPATSSNAQPRQSCEHRAAVMLLKRGLIA